ncbi:hypothetical protein MRX96_006267 [Rhipicephalus microplus]
MLRQNSALTSIAIDIRYVSAKARDIISRALVQNNTVTYFLPDYLPPLRNRATNRIREGIVRNVGLINLAVRILKRTNLTKCSAQAFEAVRGAPSLVSQLSDVAGRSEQEALAAIAAAEWCRRSNYLRITGVVKFSAVCHTIGQTQPDALNDYCWQAIAQFLRVFDVLENMKVLLSRARCFCETLCTSLLSM